MRGSTAIWRLRVALAAAFVLLFQAVSGASVGADFSAGVALDAYGNPLCASHPVQDDGPGHSGLPECCTPACPMVASALADAGAGGDFSPGLRAVIARMPAGFAADVVPARSDHDPARPRAPPVA